MPDTRAINARVVAIAAALAHDDPEAAAMLLQQITSLRDALLHITAAVEMANSVIERHGGNPNEIFPLVALGFAIEGSKDTDGE